MENFVKTTIARQYGSGGRLSVRCWQRNWEVSFYDKQIIQMATEGRAGIDVKLLDRWKKAPV